MRILAIGNSFSEDATYYLKAMADAAGEPLKVVNLYIGGCSLEQHAENLVTGEKSYRYEENGAYTEKRVCINEALTETEWDTVTIQQVSGLSGIPESCEPYMGQLIDRIKQLTPSAEIMLHRTWAYAQGCAHPQFPLYGCDRKIMDEKIRKTAVDYARKYSLKLIPSGGVIKMLIERYGFSFEELYRDGFHLSVLYGRYAAAMTWYTFLTGNKPVPFTVGRENLINGFTADLTGFDEEKAALIRTAVQEVYESHSGQF